MSGLVAGKDAIRIMVEEIGESIGQQRLREFERKVRLRLRSDGLEHTGTARDWIAAMAEVILADDDTKAERGFHKGIRRIRAQAGRVA